MTNKFNKIRYLLACATVAGSALIPLCGSAQAASRPVAIVEDSSKTEGKGQAFELLSENDTIALAPGETLVLGYLKSCLRETITGGQVTIGNKESVVEGGKVAREKTDCPVTKLALAADESQESATIAFRGQTKLIFTRQPLIIANRSKVVEIAPFDGGETWKMAPENGRIDFRAAKLEMQPGQRYRVTGDKSAIIVEVDPKASAAETGILERVVVLESKSVPSN